MAYGYAVVNTTTNRVRLSVDSTNTYDPDGSLGGRPSIRIESKQPVNQGLVIGDFAHMPGSVCGTWPACKLQARPWGGGGGGWLPDLLVDTCALKTQSGCMAPTGPRGEKSTS